MVIVFRHLLRLKVMKTFPGLSPKYICIARLIDIQTKSPEKNENFVNIMVSLNLKSNISGSQQL